MNNLIDFKLKGDKRGKLIAIEDFDIPFTIKRVFYIFDTEKNVCRGVHAHFKTKQFIIALSGSCKIILDDGVKKETFILENNKKGLFQDKMIWGNMSDFSKDCILLVFADTNYDIKDYIFSYDEFLKEVKFKNA